VNRRRRRLPAPLTALLAAVALLGLAWALVVPLFQAPDENAHYAYSQSLAERFELPGDPGRPPVSSEHDLAATASNAYRPPGAPQAKPSWDPQAEARWRAEAKGARRDDVGGPNPAAINPPLSYLVSLPAYYAASGGSIFDRLLALRLVSVLWLLATVVGVWLLAGELFRRDRALQLTAAGVAGLAPMVSFISASVTPDAMLYAVWSFALWLGVRVLHHGLTARSGAAFMALVGIGICVKATSFALVPAALLVVAIGAVRRRRAESGARGLLGVLAASCAALALTAGAWVVLARVLARGGTGQIVASPGAATASVREFASYLWQFYLPRTPLQTDYAFPLAPTLPVYDTWVKTSWAAFGWLETRFPEPVYLVLAGISLLVAVAATVAVWRARRRVDRGVLAFLAVTLGALLAGLHWTDYKLIEAGTAGFVQGRYLFPVIGSAERPSPARCPCCPRAVVRWAPGWSSASCSCCRSRRSD
jgi:hypothetical protein